MDYNKILPIKEIQPSVHIVNYIKWDDMSQIWGPRIIADFEMILIREGTFSYIEEKVFPNSFQCDKRINGSLNLTLKPGDMLLIPPGVEHVLKTESNAGAFSCIHNDPYGDHSNNNNNIKLSPTPEYKTDLFEHMELFDSLFFRTNELFESYQLYRDELLSTLCREIWLRCAARWDVQSKEVQISERMKMMLGYIKVNCQRDIGRNELAEEFNLTAEHVNSLFKKELNISPSTCINRERVLLGYSKIYNGGLSVKEAAFECGFNDPLYFSKVFKKVLGVSPSSLRR
ncbi:MAG: helix-turn-helix domain-containing protein [Spirochaetaceae bacterium]